MRNVSVSRRSALAALGAASALPAFALADAPPPKGNIKQSICRWCYGRMKIEELATKAKAMGYQSLELLTYEDFKAVQPLGMTCAVLRCASGIVNGLNRKENHEKIIKELREDIDFAAAHRIPSVLTMSGNRKGLADDVGLTHCAEGLKRVVGYAEEKKVTILMEGLNSKVNHADYMYDRTPWGAELCKKVGSPRFKLLYDIYHMQIMEGDVIATIRKYKDFIGHYHTGGCPGRNEIDETQELNYPAIIRAIVATKYEGFLGQEFIPRLDPLESLAKAFSICDV